jgi:biopolymer transport protein ExbD
MAMKFRKHHLEEPEINLIPFIDVLLVVLIFLMLSTTYSKFTELPVNLPVANADKPRENPKEVIVSITSDGRYAINRKTVDGRSVELLASEITAVVGGTNNLKEAVVIIGADASTPHQSVVTVMDAARRIGIRVAFAGVRG